MKKVYERPLFKRVWVMEYRPYPDPPVVEGRITVKRGVKVR